MKRTMEFKMERQGLLEVGQEITVTEGVLPSNYYYTIDPSLAMSGNFPFRERMVRISKRIYPRFKSRRFGGNARVRGRVSVF